MNSRLIYIFLLSATLFCLHLTALAQSEIVGKSDTLVIQLDDEDYIDNVLPQYAIDSLQPDLSVNEDSLAAVFAQMTAEMWDDDYFSRFNPSPNKALWYAALFPGGGQIYNRKYWKLPIVYGGFLGLIYGYNFNNKYFRTYSNAYRDLVLDSPNKSYMDFLPPNYNVTAKRDYLEKTFKRKKNAYRTYRDYCLVGMIGVYLVAMVDAYVDAALYHFDVSTDLDANSKPTLMLSYKVSF